MKAIATALLVGFLFVGCQFTGPRVVTSAHDWSYSELVSAIDSFRKEDVSKGPKVPKRICSIELAGEDSLKIYLSDYGAMSGGGCQLSLKKIPANGWVVVNAEFMDQ